MDVCVEWQNSMDRSTQGSNDPWAGQWLGGWLKLEGYDWWRHTDG
jgi:hypothetical protein